MNAQISDNVILQKNALSIEFVNLISLRFIYEKQYGSRKSVHSSIYLPKLAAKVKVCLSLSSGDMTTAATTMMFPITLTKSTIDITTIYSTFVVVNTVVLSHMLYIVGVDVAKVVLFNQIVLVPVVMVKNL